MDNGNLFGDLYADIKKNLTLLVVILIVAAIAAYIFSSPLFMKPRFKSTTVLYPINTIPHSDESETEQMLQLFAHEEIKESVLNTFELYERWDLKPNDPEYRHWANLLYQERVSISPTRYESVEIVCQDEDPVIARDMCLHIIDKYNEVVRQGDRDVHVEYVKLKEFELAHLNYIIDSLQSKVNDIRTESGITNYHLQSERVVEGYMNMLSSGASSSRLEKVEKMLEDLAAEGSELEVLQQKVDHLKGYHTQLTKDKIMATSKATSELNYAKIVVEPMVADKKSYPIRWIIMVISLLLAGFAGIVLVVAKERMFSKS